MGKYAETLSEVGVGGRYLLIFVTLGTQKFQMNRLMKAVDELAQEMDEEIIIQSGNSTYKPEHCTAQAFMSSEEYKNKIESCSLLITHAGVGTIITGLNAHKPVIVVPRLASMNEHVDDHQTEIAEAMEKQGYVLRCDDVSRLKEYVEKAGEFDFKPYKQQGGNIEEIIEDFIAHRKVPTLDSWEIVLDLRPKMESYVKGTNDD